MSRNENPPSARFCPQCGSATTPPAKFCTACGAALGEAVAEPRATPPFRSRAPVGWREQMPGLAVLSGFLVVGLALWVGVLSPGEAPSRLPLAEKTPAAEGGEASLPSDHPPLSLPEDVREFIAALEAEAEAAPDDLSTWRRLADVQYRASQIEDAFRAKAEASFRKVLELAPGDVDAMRGLGNVHFDRDEYDAAIEWYAKVLEARPDDQSVRTDLATMHLYSGDAEKAIALYEQVIADAPEFFQAHFNLGIAHRRRGDETAARESFERARELAPDERTRERIAAAIGEDAPAATPGGFREIVEATLRRHPIAGPKVVGFEWAAPTRGSVLLDAFPMEAMPEPIRDRFLERLEKTLADARSRSAAQGPVELALVDRATGRVMATVTAD